MDPSSQALRKVRKEVVESRAWFKLQRELLAQVHHLEYLAGEGQLRAFNSFSAREKLVIVDRAVNELGGTPACAKLQSKVASAVDRHFSSLVFQSPETRQAAQVASTSSIGLPSLTGRKGEQRGSVSNRPLAEACSRLLQESPHLKHSLKLAINHPLRSPLRLPAWRLLLQHPAVQKDYLVAVKELQPRNEEEREIPLRCQSLLNSNLAFRDLAESKTALVAMQSVMLYWKQRTGGSVMDSELLLCVPFLHVWRDELERHVGEGKGEGWLLFAEIAGQYVNLMEMLPPSIGSSTSGQSADGRTKFSQRVEELLHTEDPPLYKALQKLFKKAGGGEPSLQSSHRGSKRGGHRPFHQVLNHILLTHVQRMLVGDLSMEVLCYIWDQCFIGLDVPEYQCLPYFITVWFILLRGRLLTCKSVESMEEALSVHSLTLTTTQFQQEIEKRFLPYLSSLLKVKPLPLQPEHPHPSHPTHHPSSQPMPSHSSDPHPVPSHSSEPHPIPSHSSHTHPIPSHSSHPHPMPSHSSHTHPIPSHSSHTHPIPSHSSHPHPSHHHNHSLTEPQSRGASRRGQGTPHASISGDSTEMELQRRMEEMQQKVEREQRVLSHRMREEREEHQKQLEVFRRELGDLKMGLTGGTKKKPSAVHDQSVRSLVSKRSSSSNQPSKALLLVESGQVGNMDSQTSSRVQEVMGMRIIPVTLSPQQTLDEDRRPFSPSHLSESDVQTLWLRVLRKFTTAAYTICHGTGSERQALYSSTHTSHPTES